MQLHVLFWSSGIAQLALGIVPMGFFLRSLSFTNLSFVDAPDPLTGHMYFLQILQVLVGTLGLTFMKNAPLPATHSSASLSSSISPYAPSADSPAATCVRRREVSTHISYEQDPVGRTAVTYPV